MSVDCAERSSRGRANIASSLRVVLVCCSPHKVRPEYHLGRAIFKQENSWHFQTKKYTLLSWPVDFRCPFSAVRGEIDGSLMVLHLRTANQCTWSSEVSRAMANFKDDYASSDKYSYDYVSPCTAGNTSLEGNWRVWAAGGERALTCFLW